MRVLVFGGGAREHALAHKLNQSSQVTNLFVWPGNSVTRRIFQTLDCPLDASYDVFCENCQKQGIGLVVVGPEAPLADGLADLLKKKEIECFGPDALCARLESSKAFAKEILLQANIPTAAYSEATSEPELRQTTEKMLSETGCAVVKASGLAAGKGVFICKSTEDISEALRHLYHTSMRSASETVIVEEFLQGRECSHFTMVYNNRPVSLGFAVDFKRLKDNDEGPNTGGMGSYSPVSWLPMDADNTVMKTVVTPLLRQLEKKGMSYTGFLYTGLMWGESGPKVVEFNVRLGDPEAQILCTLDERDWLPIMLGEKTSLNDHISTQVAVGVVMASDGYPFDAPKESPGQLKISDLESPGAQVFTGSVQDGDSVNHFKTGRGRILTVVAKDHDLVSARERVYEKIGQLRSSWSTAIYRSDIAKKASSESPS